jgi:deoxyribodipyrimidine photo-lyase
MQQSQRSRYNDGLNFAIEEANRLNLPLLVYFGVTDHFPEANLRHYHFMMHGLKELQFAFRKTGIRFVLYHVSPEKGCVDLMKDAACLVMDKGYLRYQKQWREFVLKAAASSELPVYEADSHVVVPVEIASDKEEYAARTIRSKIMSKLDTYAHLPKSAQLKHQDLAIPISCSYEIIQDPLDFLNTLNLDRSVKPAPRFISGEQAAHQQLNHFLEQALPHYLDRNQPASDFCSFLSPYLHFGQISPVEIVVKTQNRLAEQPNLSDAVQSFLEELVVRRELAINFVYFNPNYDNFESMTYPWAYDTMSTHVDDSRDFLYTTEELTSCKTHDPYWNAAMKEMVHTGFMHTYMRMYWCKKIIEWSPDYQTAYETALELNNKYFLDGRDANSFTGIAWCFGKHDRAWTERPIFGKLRYMNDKGLNRKFDMAAYLRKVEQWIGEEQ